MSYRNLNTYETRPKYDNYIREGYVPVKEYENYWLFEKRVGDKFLYYECFHKFDLYGEEWTRNRGVSVYEKHKRIRNI